MNSAILFINNQKEKELARVNLLGKKLVDYAVAQIKKVDVDSVYVVGDIDYQIDGVIKRDSIKEVLKELDGEEGSCLLASPFYPLIDKEELLKLYNLEGASVFVDENDEIVPVFLIQNTLLNDFENLSYVGVKVDENKNKRFNNVKQVSQFSSEIKNRINTRWINKGVVIIDPSTTIIGEDVFIDRNTIIYPNTTILGKTLIGKDNVISYNTYLNNVIIGDNNTINSSNISNTTIHNNVSIGTNCHIVDNSEIFDGVRIGSLVKLEATRVGKNSSIENLVYLCNTLIEDDARVGSSVVTVNGDERSKHTSTIKAHSIIESGACLIAPITIGEYAVISAGSTIDQDVKNGDMATSRLYQQNKKGYGYKYKED